MRNRASLFALVIVLLLMNIVPEASAAPSLATNGTQTFRSKAARDGFVTEATETSKAGGLMDSTDTYVFVGDTHLDQEVRAILSFDTSGLPDNAIVTKARLKLTHGSTWGPDPFSSLGDLVIYIKEGKFGSSASLELVDWESPADVNAGSMNSSQVDGAYTTTLPNAAEAYINPTGNTQIRLQFETQDDDNAASDGFTLFSGDLWTTSSRPALRVEYTVP